MALERQGLTPSCGTAMVTGAAGGVGSVAIALLAKAGWHVIASTGRAAEADYLKRLGAAEIIDRAELSGPGKPLGKERWAPAVDSVGSHTLANVLAQTTYGGAVAACGLAQGMDLPASVAPFILRGVALLGIDSVMKPEAGRASSPGSGWRAISIRRNWPKSAPRSATTRSLKRRENSGRQAARADDCRDRLRPFAAGHFYSSNRTIVGMDCARSMLQECRAATSARIAMSFRDV